MLTLTSVADVRVPMWGFVVTTGMGKDLGKIAGSLKAEAATFSDAMNESLNEANTVPWMLSRHLKSLLHVPKYL